MSSVLVQVGETSNTPVALVLEAQVSVSHLREVKRLQLLSGQVGSRVVVPRLLRPDRLIGFLRQQYHSGRRKLLAI